MKYPKPTFSEVVAAAARNANTTSVISDTGLTLAGFRILRAPDLFIMNGISNDLLAANIGSVLTPQGPEVCVAVTTPLALRLAEEPDVYLPGLYFCTASLEAVSFERQLRWGLRFKEVLLGKLGWPTDLVKEIDYYACKQVDPERYWRAIRLLCNDIPSALRYANRRYHAWYKTAHREGLV